MKNEGDVKKIVKEEFKSTPDCWWFMPPANGYGRSGIPDFVGSYKGYAFAVETKFGKGKTTANQEREIALLRTSGAQVWVVNEFNIDQWHLEFNAWRALCS